MAGDSAGAKMSGALSRRGIRILLALFIPTMADLSAAGFAAPPPIDTYGHLPGVEFMALSPAGNRYAFIATVGEQRRLGIMEVDGSKIDGGKVDVLEMIGDRKIRRLVWADDSHVLIELSSTIDEPLVFDSAWEAYSMISVSLLGKAQVIFGHSDDVADVIRGYFGSQQQDGHSYGYFGGITYAKGTKTITTSGNYLNHTYPDLYRVDLDTGDARMVARGNGAIRDWALSADGTVLAHSEYRDSDSHWTLYAGDGEKKLLMQETAPLEEVQLEGQGRTPGTVLLMRETEQQDEIDEVAVADGTVQDLSEDFTVEDMIRDPVDGLLQGFRVRESSHATFFDRLRQSRYQGTGKAFPGYQVELISQTRDLGRMIVRTDGGDDSGTYWLVDIGSGKANPIGYEYPAIKPADVGPTSLVRYPAADGLDIEAVLTLPPGRKPEHLPLVVMPHGGPMGVSDRLGFDWWAQAYASRGYAVLQPNYRGSSGYGKAFHDKGWGEWGGKMLTDISAGIAELGRRGVIDPSRACIVGSSYGGYAALAGVTLQHGLYRCAVSISGVADLVDFASWRRDKTHHSDSSLVRDLLKKTGAEKTGDEVLRAISPRRFVDKADAPILLIHGTDDTVVPIEQSEDMASALKHAGKPVDFVKLNGDDHWQSRDETRVEMLKAAIAFVKDHNPPD
jgi:dipeptidyl aminopeptidase/acylaminoacyl peptidase